MNDMIIKKRLLMNFLSLFSVQGLNYLLPLITLPYLLQTIGPAKFGLISFAQALIQYFILFTDYGFNLVATKEISQLRESKAEISVVFSAVMAVKILLLLMSFAILAGLLLVVPKFQVDHSVYLLTFGLVIGNVLFPIWFFQGVENMGIISTLNLIAKAIFTVGIFVFVKHDSQFMLVALLNSLGSILTGLIALVIIYFRYHIKFSLPRKGDIVFQFKEGWHIFVSNIVTSLYTTSNTFILGFVANNTVVGYYSGAEKIVRVASSVIAPLIQTVYPLLSKALGESKERTMAILRRVFLLVTVTMAILSVLIGFGAGLLVRRFLPGYIESVALIHILAPLPFILGWANVFGILTMINFEYKKELSRIYICSAVLSLILMGILVPVFKQYGTAVNAVVTEAFATALMISFVWKKGIYIWRKVG